MTTIDHMPPLAATGWRVYRIVPSRFPPVSLFDQVADPGDLEALYAIEAITNDRIRDEVGNIALVPAEDRVTGPGATPIMAAFTHLNPDGSRFCDASFGAYYAGLDIETAVAETVYHRERMLADSDETAGRPIDVDMRCYAADLNGDLHDVRSYASDHPELLSATSYASAQAFGATLRNAASNGIIYPSVRRPHGTCVVVYRPKCLSNCIQERHLTYQWDGARIYSIYEKSSFDPS